MELSEPEKIKKLTLKKLLIFQEMELSRPKKLYYCLNKLDA